MSRRALVLIAVVTAFLAQALPAQACSCWMGDPRDAFARSDGAIVGTLLARRPATDSQGQPNPNTAVNTFRVDEAYKGEFGDTVDVYSASSGAACGLEIAEGQQAGLLLSYSEQDETWWGSLCATMSPQDLREAAAPLPEPDGRGPLRLLLGGSWGESSYLALDARGRTLAYSFGDHDSSRLEVCPGRERFLELYRVRRAYVLAARDLQTNDVLWERTTPLGRGDYADEAAVRFECAARSGGSVLVATVGFSDDSGHLVRIGRNRSQVLYEGKLSAAVFAGRGVAYVLRENGALARVSLADGSDRRIATLSENARGLESSPNGRYLSAYTGRQIVVVDLDRGGRVSSGAFGTPRYGGLHWVDSSSLVFLPEGEGPITVVDADLDQKETVPGEWWAWSNVVVDGTVYGVGDGTLLRVKLPAGPVEKLRDFPSFELLGLEGVPGSVDVDWPGP